jgi:hypothetical protein
MSTKLDSLYWCKNCVSMSTRPRIGFVKEAGVICMVNSIGRFK